MPIERSPSRSVLREILTDLLSNNDEADKKPMERRDAVALMLSLSAGVFLPNCSSSLSQGQRIIIVVEEKATSIKNIQAHRKGVAINTALPIAMEQEGVKSKDAFDTIFNYDAVQNPDNPQLWTFIYKPKVRPTQKKQREIREGGRGEEEANEASEATFNKLKKVVDKYLGTPYKHSGMGPEDGGFGPSGFAIRVFKEGAGISLPRGAASQSQLGGKKIAFEQLKPGDLIFFSTNRKTITSVAIYMGSNQMAIADGKVKITDVNSWFRKRFSYGKRLLENPPEDRRTEEAEVARSDKRQQIDDQKIAENLSEDELNGMPKATWKKLFGARRPFMGRPYKGRGKNGIDCSGFTSSMYDKWADILQEEQLKLSRYARSTETQANVGDLVPKAKGKGLEVFKNLKIGDLILFSISENWRQTNVKGKRKHRPGSKPSHVAIYIGNGQMLHSGTSKGVTIVDLDAWSDYWVDYFVYGRRLIYWEGGKPVIKK